MARKADKTVAEKLLAKCNNGRGDGLLYISAGHEVICLCPLCTGARWVRNQAARGLISAERAEGARELVRALGGQP